MGSKLNNIGVYIHIPFCIKKCSYCDFISLPTPQYNDGIVQEYITAVTTELEAKLRNNDSYIDTIYFGGGTPSILKISQLERIIELVFTKGKLSQKCEITIEANPETINKTILNHYLAIGINRLSIGIQTLIEKELKILGRIYDSKTAIQAAHIAATSKFHNYSFDILYGIPSQTYATLRETLKELLKFKPTHISAYELTLDNNTWLDKSIKKGYVTLPAVEKILRMQKIIIKYLKDVGLKRYEVSNYAKTGYECLHNLHYWNYDDYIGVGLSASGFLNGTRYTNTSSLCDYLKRVRENQFPVEYCEELTEEQINLEKLMLRLRLVKPLPKKLLEKMFIKGLGKYLNRWGFLNTSGFASLNYITTELM